MELPLPTLSFRRKEESSFVQGKQLGIKHIVCRKGDASLRQHDKIGGNRQPAPHLIHINTMKKPDIHTGKIIRTYIKKRRFFISALARDMGRNYYTTFRFLKRSSMQTNVLLDVSLALRYNFFREIAEQLPPELPPHYDTDKDAEIAHLKEHIQQLETENKTLKEAIKLVGGS